MAETKETPFADNLRGALFMSASMAGFALNDGVMKLVLEDLPLFPAILVRGAVACAILLALCRVSGALSVPIAGRDWRLIGWRTLAEVGATLTFLTALANMPIANASAILQANPLAVTLGAALFLGEPLGWRRSLALGLGFLGVLLIVRPGAASFNGFSLYAVATVGFIVLRDLSTRRLSPGVPSLKVALITALAITGVAGAGSAAAPWPAMDLATVALLALAGVFLIVAYVFAVRGMRVGDVAFAAPFRYTILIWSVLIGMVLFAEIPDRVTLIGAALVVGSGLYAFWREQRLRARREPAIVAKTTGRGER